MTVLEAIHSCDARRHNSCSLEEKVAWLSQLDGKIKALILDTHEGPEIPFETYRPEADLEKSLLVGEPFHEVYLYWLEAQVCCAEGDIGGYNTAIAQYNRLFLGFSAHHTRNHMPKNKGRFRF